MQSFGKVAKQLRSRMVCLVPSQARMFQPSKDTDILLGQEERARISGYFERQKRYEQLIKNDKEAFEKLPLKEKTKVQATQILLEEIERKEKEDPENWWLKFQTMSEIELNALPLPIQRKYLTVFHKIEEFERQLEMEYKETDPRYQKHKGLDELLSNEEIREKQARIEFLRETHDEFDFDKSDYMARQPRVKNIRNYNFEQYKQYTEMFNEAKARDEKELKTFYKTLQYAKTNPHTTIARSFMKKYEVDKITVPEEFKEIDITGFKPEPKGRKIRRPVILTRSSRDITNYSAFRTLEHFNGVQDLGCNCTSKIQIAPRDLERVFGQRDTGMFGDNSSGSYMFLDSNMDAFLLAEHRLTQEYHGENREQEWYDKRRNLTPFKRPKRYPTEDEFWSSEKPQTFKIYADKYSEWRKFKVWISTHMQNTISEKPQDWTKNKEIAQRFDEELKDTNIASFDQVTEMRHDPAVFKYDFLEFLTKEEIKKLAKSKHPIKFSPPKYFDLSKAERIVLTQEQIEEAQQAETEELNA